MNTYARDYISAYRIHQSTNSFEFRRLFFIVFSALIILLSFFIISKELKSGPYWNAVSIVLLINYIYCLFAYKITIGMRLVSFPICFMSFYYLMHFGEIFMLGFFPTYKYDYMDYLSTYMVRDVNSLIATVIVCYITISSFFIGTLFVPKKMVLSSDAPLENDFKFTSNSFHFGKTVFFFLLPFRLLLDVLKFYFAFSNGYSGTFSLGIPGFVSSLGVMWYCAVPMYYIEINNRKNKNVFLVFCILYILFSMITGERGHQIIGLVTIAVTAYAFSRKKITLVQLIKYILIICVLLFLLNILFEFRHLGIKNISNNFISIFSNAFKKNILLETIGTFGETIFTPYLVIQGYGNTFTPFFGECFLKSLGSIVPDFTGLLKNINNEAIFAKMLGTEHAIGGSFAGEMYYNFGKLYWLFSFLFGFIYSVSSLSFNNSIVNSDKRKVYLLLPLLSFSLWWVRDSIGDLTRLVVWFWILYFVYFKIINSNLQPHSNLIKIERR